MFSLAIEELNQEIELANKCNKTREVLLNKTNSMKNLTQEKFDGLMAELMGSSDDEFVGPYANDYDPDFLPNKRENINSTNTAERNSPEENEAIYGLMKEAKFLDWFDGKYAEYRHRRTVEETDQPMGDLFRVLDKGAISLNDAKEQAARYYYRRNHFEHHKEDSLFERQERIKNAISDVVHEYDVKIGELTYELYEKLINIANTNIK